MRKAEERGASSRENARKVAKGNGMSVTAGFNLLYCIGSSDLGSVERVHAEKVSVLLALLEGVQLVLLRHTCEPQERKNRHECNRGHITVVGLQGTWYRVTGNEKKKDFSNTRKRGNHGRNLACYIKSRNRNGQPL